MKKILLIAPTYVDAPNTMYFPIGMAYLASFLNSKGYEVEGFNMNNVGYKEGIRKLENLIEENDYDVIGIGALIVALEQMEKLTKFIKTITDAKIVFGGGITSCEAEIVIKELKPDYMIISEAEIIFLELLEYMDSPKSIKLPKGVWSYKDGVIESNSESNAIAKLDSLPYPDYEIMGIQGFIGLQKGEVWSHHKSDTAIKYWMPISASRSCPFKCTFCHHAGMGTYRQHSIKYTVEFIKLMSEKYHIKHFLIYDELFSLNKKRVAEFCEEIKTLNITFFCQLRVDQVDEEMLTAMKNSGCIEISYGIESGSDVVLDSMQKKITAAQLKETLSLTRKMKIGIQGNFLFGDTAETHETVKESLQFQEDNKLYFTDWSMVLPYPETPLHRLAISKGLIKDRFQFIKDIADTAKYLWSSPINLTKFSDEEYLKIYSELRELNDIHHRKVHSIVIDAFVKDKYHSFMKIKCPHCNFVNEYESVPFPLNSETAINKNRESFFGFLGINLICPSCRSKHHLVPKNIPHVSSLFSTFQKKYQNFILGHENDVVFMPAMDRHFNSVSEDTILFNTSPCAVLDTREYRINQNFLGAVVQRFSTENIIKLKSKKFLILPWVESDAVYEELLSNGIPVDDILKWN